MVFRLTSDRIGPDFSNARPGRRAGGQPVTFCGADRLDSFPMVYWSALGEQGGRSSGRPLQPRRPWARPALDKASPLPTQSGSLQASERAGPQPGRPAEGLWALVLAVHSLPLCPRGNLSSLCSRPLLQGTGELTRKQGVRARWLNLGSGR